MATSTRRQSHWYHALIGVLAMITVSVVIAYVGPVHADPSPAEQVKDTSTRR